MSIRLFVLGFVFALTLAPTFTHTALKAAAEPIAEPIWPHGRPGEQVAGTAEAVVNRQQDQNELGLNRSYSHVTQPTIAIHLPPREAASGVAVIICPGGGFTRVVIDKEGHDVARRLNSFGIAAVVLKYRTKNSRDEPLDRPLADVQRSVRIIRSRAEALNVDPGKIGVMGFSAGGNLAAAVGTHFDLGKQNAADPIERVSCRPDFLAGIYPAWLDRLVEGVTAETPPAFLVHAGDDGLPAELTAQFYIALKKAKVPAELHLYTTGGHGFGLGIHGGPVATWPNHFADWLKQLDFAR